MELEARFGLLFIIPSMAMMSCSDDGSDFDEGVYKRIYSRDQAIHELVELQDGNRFQQSYYDDGRLRFVNVGSWQFVARNSGHAPKWPSGRSLILFSGWMSAEEILRRERLGDSVDASALTTEDVAALVRDRRRFAFDEDGGSDYKRQ